MQHSYLLHFKQLLAEHHNLAVKSVELDRYGRIMKARQDQVEQKQQEILDTLQVLLDSNEYLIKELNGKLSLY